MPTVSRDQSPREEMLVATLSTSVPERHAELTAMILAVQVALGLAVGAAILLAC